MNTAIKRKTTMTLI